LPDSDPLQEREFARKVVVVTGGSAGIGRGVALAFAKRGAHVVIAGRNIEAAERAAGEIAREAKIAALAVQADVSAPEQCEKLIAEAVAHFGGLDVLVNNAAHFALVPLIEAVPETARQFIDTNLLGPLQCGRALAHWAIQAKARGRRPTAGSIRPPRRPSTC
jgi:NAD(P)-dependent dehydrogenase (short-subunit alcohol dehydrogenase family)